MWHRPRPFISFDETQARVRFNQGASRQEAGRANESPSFPTDGENVKMPALYEQRRFGVRRGGQRLDIGFEFAPTPPPQPPSPTTTTTTLMAEIGNTSKQIYEAPLAFITVSNNE